MPYVAYISTKNFNAVQILVLHSDPTTLRVESNISSSDAILMTVLASWRKLCSRSKRPEVEAPLSFVAPGEGTKCSCGTGGKDLWYSLAMLYMLLTATCNCASKVLYLQEVFWRAPILSSTCCRRCLLLWLRARLLYSCRRADPSFSCSFCKRGKLYYLFINP